MDDSILILAGGALLLGLGLFVLRRKKTGAKPADRGDSGPQPGLRPLPPEITLAPQALLSDREAALYNLLRLAVQEEFLVLAQVPFWCLVTVQAQDRQTRSAFLNQLALKRVDFALVHPGSRLVVKVVELREARPSPQREARDRLLDAVCAAAEIEVIRLDDEAAATLPALAASLGLDREE